MSIQALEWARRQVVGDALAKSLLRAVADYADESGHCFPSLGRLSSDCEVSEDTIRRKMKLLEDADYLVRVKTWMDEHGRRNFDGLGRETSHEIRLRLARAPEQKSRESGGAAPGSAADVADPAAAGEGLQPARVAACEGSSVQGAGLQAATPGVALVPPPNEPSSKKEDSPQSPPEPEATEAGYPRKEASEAQNLDGLERFKATYPAPSNRPAQVVSLWAALSAVERAKRQRGAEGLRAYWERDPKRRPAVVAPEKFLADPALGLEFERFAPPPAPKADPAVMLVPGSVEWRACAVARAVVGRAMPKQVALRAIPTGAEVLAVFAAEDGTVDESRWQLVRSGTAQCAAWVTRVAEWTGERAAMRNIRLQGPPVMRRLLSTETPFYPMASGLMVPPTPSGFPPAKFAGQQAETTDPPMREGTLMTADDEAFERETGI